MHIRLCLTDVIYFNGVSRTPLRYWAFPLPYTITFPRVTFQTQLVCCVIPDQSLAYDRPFITLLYIVGMVAIELIRLFYV